jgi:5-methylcytosine-specific restriction endonuclease McrA
MGRTGKGGPTGRPWRRVRAAVLAASDVCYLCGHPGSGAVDHVISRKERPDLALDPANLRPVHGSLSRCPWCKRACNEVKGDRAGLPERQQPRQSRRW